MLLARTLGQSASPETSGIVQIRSRSCPDLLLASWCEVLRVGQAPWSSRPSSANSVISTLFSAGFSRCHRPARRYGCGAALGRRWRVAHMLAARHGSNNSLNCVGGLLNDKSRRVGATLRAASGSDSIIFTQLPPGRYAVIAFHGGEQQWAVGRQSLGCADRRLRVQQQRARVPGPPPSMRSTCRSTALRRASLSEARGWRSVRATALAPEMQRFRRPPIARYWR